MASPITRPQHITTSPPIVAGSSVLSAPSPTTAKVAEFFRKYNECLDENFTSYTHRLYRCHFENSKKAILQAARGLCGTAILLGVGSANDLPLEELANQFDCIDIVDIDLTMADTVIAKLPMDIKHKFRTHAIDLTGIIRRLDEILDVVIESKAPHEEFCDRAIETLQRLRKAELPLKDHSASFVVSSLVCSQISYKLYEYLELRSQTAYGKGLFHSSDDKKAELFSAIGSMEKSHIQDLHRLVEAEGRVYFSDHFSYQDVESFVCNSEIIFLKDKTKTMITNSLETQKFSDKYFKTVTEEKWDWMLPMYKKQECLIPLENKRFLRGFTATHKKFNVTALTLAPK